MFNKQMRNQMDSMKKFKDLTPTDRVKVINESWSKLKDEQKQQYVDMAA